MVADEDLPPIGDHEAQVILASNWVEKPPKLLPHLSWGSIYLLFSESVIRFPWPDPLNPLLSDFLPLVLFFRKKLHPDGGGCYPLAPLRALLQLGAPLCFLGPVARGGPALLCSGVPHLPPLHAVSARF